MNFSTAIHNNYITDYKIWLPSIHEDNTKLEKKLSIYEIEQTIKTKCIFLFSCLMNNGSRKCIVYCKNTEELNQMMEAIRLMNKYYYLDCHMDSIICHTSETDRSNKLDTFSKSNKLELLFSIRILDECIDIPSCDSIFISYSSNSKIRTIQRLCRCIRIDVNNKFKIGNVYVWCV